MLAAGPDGVIVTVWVVPGASRPRIGGERDGALKVWTTAPPEDGRANRAVADMVAAHLGARHAEVIRGHTVRRKEILVRGVALEDARRVLDSG